ncbi:MAG TPA: hypothetical protein VKW08_24050 [Xanthobacteraceae bacterium]|nr:hypothetical protein [Xanthobacteraceae bacterium]
MTNSIMAKTTIALATVLTLGGASVALANDIDESASTAQATREWNQYLNQKTPSHQSNARAAYGFVQSKSPQADNGHYSDRVDDNR